MIADQALDLWRNSTLIDPARRRPMAYLFDFPTFDLMCAEAASYVYDPYNMTIAGWPVYTGPFAGPDGILFLPERTVRSMAGIFPA